MGLGLQAEAGDWDLTLPPPLTPALLRLFQSCQPQMKGREESLSHPSCPPQGWLAEGVPLREGAVSWPCCLCPSELENSQPSRLKQGISQQADPCLPKIPSSSHLVWGQVTGTLVDTEGSWESRIYRSQQCLLYWSALSMWCHGEPSQGLALLSASKLSV